VEVGIDVPNATVMVVEHAERFGLAQLHQLRGRVGRGSERSSCILLYQYPITEDGRERLKMMTETTDGFVIAEKDLELRGPGDVFGTRQAGAPTLRVGDLRRDHVLMEEARREAARWLDAGASDPEWLQEFRRTWGQRYGLIAVG
jgi:ATP-dependent DNA helicase RecG